MKENIKYLAKNTGLLFISSFSSKFLVFLLVPFYTYILTTEEYGIFDILYNTAQILIPILSLNISDAVGRYVLDAENDVQKKTFNSALYYINISIVILIIATLVCVFFLRIDILIEYSVFFVLLYIAYIYNQFITQFVRGKEDIAGVAIAGIIGTSSLILFNLIFLLLFKKGLKGYFLANILALFFPAVFLLIRNKNYSYFNYFERDKKFEKELLNYCIPLMFTTLSWYINNISDRYVVTWFCGIDTNGLYSISYKIPAIMNAFQVVFIQAWQLSGIKEYGSEAGNRLIRQVYKACQAGVILLCACLIFSTKFLARILFQNDFYSAWVFVPTLLLYIVFNLLSGTIGVVLSAVKDSKAFALSAIAGAFVNIILNIVLVYKMGPEGAAIATVISSIVIWMLRMKYANKYIEIGINKVFIVIQFGLVFVQAAIMTCISGFISYLIQGLIILLLLSLSFYENRFFIEYYVLKKKRQHITNNK